ncbi:hypothetical protein GC163_18210 [bacterium]|nr:hypothetical protein [bacterium]
MNTTEVPATTVLRPGIPGKYVVIGMFILGSIATATIYIYWDLHTKPFRPLTEAIGREFRHSLPKVEGGRHKKGPATLRITVRVPFLPSTNTDQSQRFVNRLTELAREHTNLEQYEVFQIHLVQMAPEQLAVDVEFNFPTEEVATKVPYDLPPEEPATTTAQ